MGEHRSRSTARGLHVLGPRTAADLVRNAGITRGDLVVDIGAGPGAMTRALAARARHVIAIEADRHLAAKLRAPRNVTVVCADARSVDLPREPFRVVANLPFAGGTAILRRLLDPTVQLLRADVVVEWGLAAKRCSQRPSTLLTMSWAPWFELTITRRLSRRVFRPPPPVDAAVMTVTRRPDPLLPVGERDRFVRFLRRGFAKRADATDLDAWEWTRAYRRSCM